jgi:hypothetical protein
MESSNYILFPPAHFSVDVYFHIKCWQFISRLSPVYRIGQKSVKSETLISVGKNLNFHTAINKNSQRDEHCYTWTQWSKNSFTLSVRKTIPIFHYQVFFTLDRMGPSMSVCLSYIQSLCYHSDLGLHCYSNDLESHCDNNNLVLNYCISNVVVRTTVGVITIIWILI